MKTIYPIVAVLLSLVLCIGVFFVYNPYFFLNSKWIWILSFTTLWITFLALCYLGHILDNGRGNRAPTNKFTISFLIVLCLGNGIIWWRALAQPMVFTHENKLLYFSEIQFNSKDGTISFGKLLGLQPPNTGAYSACELSFEKFIYFFKAKARLCVSHDLFGRMTLHFDERDLGDYHMREFILHGYGLSEQTLLKEAYQQQQTRFIYTKNIKDMERHFQLREYFIFHLAELENSPAKILESLSYDGDDRLISFTETSLLNARQKDVFAEYDARGKLIARPRLNNSFIFPSRINTERFNKYQLAKYLP